MRMSSAIWKPLPENATQREIIPTQLILHTAACKCGDSLWDDFMREGQNKECHFYVRWDGTVEQYMDTEVKADANYKANVRAISVETQDDGDPSRPWTTQQQASIISIIVWANRHHGIPIRFTPAWDQPGIGYHVMWGAPGPWTPVAKSCPGPVRIRQISNLIIRARTIALGEAMTPEQEAKLDQLIVDVAGIKGHLVNVENGDDSMNPVLREVRDLVRRIATKLGA